jgi:hypothetical protein
MLTPAIIANVRAFMQRVPLKGEEVPAYNEIMAALATEEQLLTRPLTEAPVASE